MADQGATTPSRASTVFHLIGFSFWQAWWLLAMNAETILPQAMTPSPFLNPVFCITVFTTAGYLALALVGMRFGSLSVHRASYWCAGILASAGSMGLGVFPMTGTLEPSGVLFVASCIAFALGNALLLIMWGELWSSWASGRVGTCLGASYTFAFVLYLALALIPEPAGSLLSCLLPIASLVALNQARDEEKRPPSQVEFEIESFSPWKAIVAAGAVGAIHGFVQCGLKTISPNAHVMYFSLIVSGALLACIVVYLLARQPSTASLALYRPIVPCFIGGLALMTLLPDSAAALGNGLALTAVFCVDMLVMLVSTDIAFRTRTPVAVCFGLTLFAMRLGTTLGLAVTGAIEAGGGLNAELYRQAMLICIIAIAVIASFVFTSTDLTNIYRAKPSENTDADTSSRTQAIARACRLTPRESEILSFLAAGRSAPYIAGELCIAESTVKHHTSSIYRKIGVSDRQSLIDVIMRGAAGKGAL